MIFKDIETINYSNKEKTCIDFFAVCEEYGRIPMTLSIVDTEDLHTIIVDGKEIPLEVYCLKQNIGDYVEPEVIPLPTPDVITPLQFKLQLLEMNLVKDVEDILVNDPKAKIYYENVQSVEKSSPVLLDIASKLGMSQTDIDDFFIKAKAIVA